MIITILLGLLAGGVPSLLIFFWFKKTLNYKTDLYKKNCGSMLNAGLLAIFPVILMSGTVSVILNLSGVKSSQPLLYAALHTFLVFALSEELAKYFMFRSRLNKIKGEHSWMDLIIYSTIVGIGFGLLESIVFALDSNPLVMLIRGISIPHGGYAAIVGYFYGMSINKNSKGYAALGVFIAFLIHGLYDFSLSEELSAFSDAAAVVALTLALLDVIIIIVLIVFIRKHKNDPKYTEPIAGTPRIVLDQAESDDLKELSDKDVL